MAAGEVQVYGASDDLIEVEGDINEEFSPSETEALLAFNEGTVLRIMYRDGVWRVVPVRKGKGELSIVQAPEGDEDNYTDRATLRHSDLRWVVLGSEIANSGS